MINDDALLRYLADSVEFFMAFPAKTLQRIEMEHVITQQPIVSVMHDEAPFTATSLTFPTGIVFHLKGHQFPVPRVKIILIKHGTDKSTYPALVNPAGFIHHAVESIALSRLTWNEVLLSEIDGLVFLCPYHHCDRLNCSAFPYGKAMS